MFRDKAFEIFRAAMVEKGEFAVDLNAMPESDLRSFMIRVKSDFDNVAEDISKRFCSSKSGEAIEIYVGFYHSDAPNAQAFLHHGNHLVGISTEMLVRTEEMIQRLTKADGFWTFARQAGWRTEDNMTMAKSLVDFFLMWVLFHELGHHYNGDTQNGVHYVEFCAGSGDLKSQAHELAADEVATRLLARNLVALPASQTLQGAFQTNIIGARFAVVVTMTLFFILSPYPDPAKPIRERRHPTPTTRFDAAMTFMNSELNLLGKPALIPEEVRPWFRAVKNAVPVSESWEAIEQFLNTPPGVKYTSDLYTLTSGAVKEHSPAWIEWVKR